MVTEKPAGPPAPQPSQPQPPVPALPPEFYAALLEQPLCRRTGECDHCGKCRH